MIDDKLKEFGDNIMNSTKRGMERDFTIMYVARYIIHNKKFYNLFIESYNYYHGSKYPLQEDDNNLFKVSELSLPVMKMLENRDLNMRLGMIIIEAYSKAYKED